jgi:iron complex outermembrane recepter protein
MLQFAGIGSFLFISIFASGQVLVGGRVTDSETGAGLPFCSVIHREGSAVTQTDLTGRFTIGLPAAVNQHLIFSFVGYQSDTLLVTSTSIAIRLTPEQGILQEIVIGASYVHGLKDSPVAVSQVLASALDRVAASNIIDALTQEVPGLSALKTGPNISKPFIRGLGYNRVLTLYDGMRQEGQQWGDEHGVEVDNYNIEKAEVIKGPASLMFGSDAIAGVVALHPYAAGIDDGTIHGRLLAEFQSNNKLVGQAMRMSYGSKGWSVAWQGSYRLAGNYFNKADGYVYNTSFREKNASLMVRRKHRNGDSQWSVTGYDNLQGIPDGSRDSLSRKFTKQVLEFPQDDVKKRPLVTEQELISYDLSPLHQHIQHYRAYAREHFQVKGGSLSALLGFQQNIRREYDHPTDPEQAGLFVRLNTLNYGIQYALPSTPHVRVSLGANGMMQDNKNKKSTDFPIPDYRLFDLGEYIMAGWTCGKMTASGGIRSDFRSARAPDFFISRNPSTGWDEQVSSSDTARLAFPAFTKYYHGTSWSVGSTLQASDKWEIKANVARGYRAPNITEISSAGLDPGAHIVYVGDRNFIPEFNIQEDLGISLIEENFQGSFGVFNNVMHHYIYLSEVTDTDGNPVQLQGGNKEYQYKQSAAQLYGLETSLDGSFLKAWGLRLRSDFSVTYGFNRSAIYRGAGIRGEFLPFIPPARWSNSLNKEITLRSKSVSGMRIGATVDWIATQNRYSGLGGTETRTPGYMLVNLSAGFEWRGSGKSRAQFLLQANNLFDRIYQSNMSRLKYFEYYQQAPNGRSGIYSMGRNFCVRLIYSW